MRVGRRDRHAPRFAYSQIGRKGIGMRTAHAFARDVLWGVATVVALYMMGALLVH